MFGVLLLVPSMATFIFYDDYVALLMISIILFSFPFFYIGAGISYKVGAQRKLDFTIRNNRLVWLLFYMFIITYILMFIEFGGIPILQYSSGGNSSLLRAEFTKGEGGLISILTYFKSIFSKGVLPIIVCWFYINESKKLFVTILLLLIFLLISAFEKSGLVWIFVPLLVLQLHQRKYKEVWYSLIFVVFCTGLVSVVSLSHIAKNNYPADSKQHDLYYAKVDNINDDKALYTQKYQFEYAFQDKIEPTFTYASIRESEDDYQFLLTFNDTSNPLFFMINRVFWIPFITAYDTLLFWQENYQEHLYFGINRYLAAITDYRFADLERRVFKFQFGSGTG